MKSFSPSYFAMVMATGIVSVSAHLLGYEAIATALFSALPTRRIFNRCSRS